VATFIAEFGSGSVSGSAIRACEFKSVPAFIAKLGSFAIIKLTFWTFHFALFRMGDSVNFSSLEEKMSLLVKAHRFKIG
jgi:hypothetical protein